MRPGVGRVILKIENPTYNRWGTLEIVTSYNPQEHVMMEAEVESVSLRTGYDRDNAGTGEWDPHIEVVPGDRVYVDYHAMVSMLGHEADPALTKPEPEYWREGDVYYLPMLYTSLLAKRVTAGDYSYVPSDLSRDFPMYQHRGLFSPKKAVWMITRGVIAVTSKSAAEYINVPEGYFKEINEEYPGIWVSRMHTIYPLNGYVVGERIYERVSDILDSPLVPTWKVRVTHIGESNRCYRSGEFDSDVRVGDLVYCRPYSLRKLDQRSDRVIVQRRHILMRYAV